MTSTPSRIRHSTTASEPFISWPISAFGKGVGEERVFMAGRWSKSPPPQHVRGGDASLGNWVGGPAAPAQPRGVLKLLFIGDIVGRPGRGIVEERVPGMRRELGLDFVIANGENSAAGAGITGLIARSLLESGVDAVTLGDHVWDQRGWENEIGQIDRVCRPANLPAACPGWDHVVIEARG